MELVFEILNAKQFVPTALCQMTFKQSGGVIGRGKDCDWPIPDSKRHLSSHHALVNHREGAFFLTDISNNGIQNCTSGARLRKGEAVRIEHGNVYVLGDFEIRARLIGTPMLHDDIEVGRPQAAGSVIPDDAFFDLDPLKAFDQQERELSEIEALISPRTNTEAIGQRADYARIDMESLTVPELVVEVFAPEPTVPKPVERQADGFWEKFGAALGVSLADLDHDAREALALKVAHLLRQSIGGLQQSLRTRSDLKSELRLAQTTVQGSQINPLKFAIDPAEALGILLQSNKPGQLPAEQAVSRTFRDLQAHQVALLTASRAVVRSTLEHFSPYLMTLRFERDNKPLFATSGSRWRAYERYHQTLCQDNDWSERLLSRDFAQAYEEQIRLISTLHTDHQG